jgi:DNA repair exonuclease SbcCD nuclease subunit
VGEGQPLVGSGLTVGLEDLALAGAHANICSHIHKPQTFHFNGAPTFYCGSPSRHDFGEPEPKNILSLTISGDRVTHERIPTPARDMVLFDVTWDPDLQAFRWSNQADALCLYGTQENRARGSDCRIKYRVNREHVDAAKRAAAAWEERLLGMGAATVKVVDEVIAETRARDAAVAVSEAGSLEDKLDALWTAQNRMPAPPVRERLRGRLASLEAR